MVLYVRAFPDDLVWPVDTTYATSWGPNVDRHHYVVSLFSLLMGLIVDAFFTVAILYITLADPTRQAARRPNVRRAISIAACLSAFVTLANWSLSFAPNFIVSFFVERYGADAADMSIFIFSYRLAAAAPFLLRPLGWLFTFIVCGVLEAGEAQIKNIVPLLKGNAVRLALLLALIAAAQFAYLGWLAVVWNSDSDPFNVGALRQVSRPMYFAAFLISWADAMFSAFQITLIAEAYRGLASKAAA